MGLDVDNAVDAHFASLAQVGGMKNGCTRGNKDFIFHPAPDDMRVRSDQAIIANAQSMAAVAADLAMRLMVATAWSSSSMACSAIQ